MTILKEILKLNEPKYIINYNFWMTLHSYLEQNELSDDIISDSKKIKSMQYLWQECSKLYLAKCDSDDLVDMWYNADSVNKLSTYQECYNEFVGYLWCASDRMSPNRWLRLQMLIQKACNLIYDKYCQCYGSYGWYQDEDIEEDLDGDLKDTIINEFNNGFYEKYKEVVENEK